MGIVLLTSITLTTIVYSAFNIEFQISGDAYLRVKEDIRISNLKLMESKNGASEDYNCKYGKDTTSMYVTLPSNSSVTYEAEITNNDAYDYLVNFVDVDDNGSLDISVELSIRANEIITKNSTKKYTIKLSNNSSKEIKKVLVLNYYFVRNKFTVTFNANGGSVNTLSKEVAYGSSYGLLPTPVREGYKFLGWNGKNLINYNKELEGDISSDSEGNISDGSPNSDPRGWHFIYNNGWRAELNPGTYILSLSFGKLSTKGDNRCIVTSSVLYPNADSPLVEFSLLRKQYVEQKFTLNSKDTVNILCKGYDGVYKIQLNEGSISTEWEPYFVTDTVKVTRTSNHVLTAIWQKN